MNTPITEQILRERLAANVRALRDKLGLTLKVASERAEIHWRYWQKIEAAKVYPTLQILVRLANSLSIDPTALMQP